MNEQAYELTALAMRYWFTALILVACLCGLRLLIAERRQARREKLAAPNMEYVGELLVVRGSESVPRGERYAIQRDFVIGRRRKCDVCLGDRSVFPRHARGELRNGGMLIGAIGRAPVALRGQPLSQEVLVKDGALFCIGALTLQLTLYDVPVEYIPSQRRAIDATDAQGDQFDVEAPFEHEFDDEYGPRQSDAAEQDAPEDYAPEDYAPEEAPDYDDAGSEAGERDAGADDTPDYDDEYGAEAYDGADEWRSAPDAEYRRELEQQRSAQNEQPFNPITIARTRAGRRGGKAHRPSDDDDDDDMPGAYEYPAPDAEWELDEYEEYALETEDAEQPDEAEAEYGEYDARPYPRPPRPVRQNPTEERARPAGPYAAAGRHEFADGPEADELEDYPGRPGAVRRAQRAQGGAPLPPNDSAAPSGRVRRS